MKHGERPKTPAAAGWHHVGVQPGSDDGLAGPRHGWLNPERGLQVLSAVDVADDSETGLVLPHWHVSVVRRRPPAWECTTASDEEVELVRAAFNIGGAEEDNHGPGVARHLWMVCGRKRQPDCACKQDEDRIVEGDRVRFETAESAGGVL